MLGYIDAWQQRETTKSKESSVPFRHPELVSGFVVKKTVKNMPKLRHRGNLLYLPSGLFK
jgi:hypothetical protein